tara:strand:+ start:1632 stop:1823 length:192 start_codon:yes stop_codon:yes gene_type:complete
MNEKHLDVAQDIIEQILPKEFNWYIYVTEHTESGELNKVYSEKSDRLLNGILQILEKNYKNND